MTRRLVVVALLGGFAGLPACREDRMPKGGPKEGEYELRIKMMETDSARRKAAYEARSSGSRPNTVSPPTTSK